MITTKERLLLNNAIKENAGVLMGLGRKFQEQGSFEKKVDR